ncbi:hypothetical protein BBJ29_003014 [Phytophthora kernoviae]|uniref:EF-hand domain-containing protein n=1 Tax=Phytophthora kernoviae TaxID=325452 RepID=A0A3F2S237_9STRA|nr:hypothetical protein BBJ29_003014 [Phytophthora kernoviae]RLN68708.1 hypothetical protein BBP00_00000828 [Phytophthora kernoviae]
MLGPRWLLARRLRPALATLTTFDRRATFFSFPSSSHSLTKSHKETRVVPFTCSEMFDVVADVDRYREFLPFCVESRVLQRPNDNVMEAALRVGFNIFTESYTSRVLMIRPNKIVTKAIDSPTFKRIESEWIFKPCSKPGSCEIDFKVTFEVSSILHANAIQLFFDDVALSQLNAFIGRARKLYESTPRPVSKAPKQPVPVTQGEEYEDLKDISESAALAGAVFSSFETSATPKEWLSMDEFVVGVYLMTKGTFEQKALSLFEIVNSTGDGKITREELTCAMQRRICAVKKLFPKLLHDQVQIQMANEQVEALSSSQDAAVARGVQAIEGLMEEVEKEIPLAVNQIFREADLDQDDYIREQEWLFAWQAHPEFVELLTIDGMKKMAQWASVVNTIDDDTDDDDQKQANWPILFAGTYTRDEGWINGTGKGIYTYKLDTTDGTLTPFGVTPLGINPMYVLGTTKTFSQGERVIYAVNAVTEDSTTYPGTQTGYVSALTLNSDGTLELLNTLETHGGSPTHLSLSPKEDFVVVSNYGGTLSMFPLNDDGSLAKDTFNKEYLNGSKVVMDQQAAGHIHSTTWLPNSNHVVAANLGSDELLQFNLNSAKQTLESLNTVKRPAGSGPRHMALNPKKNIAYVVDEISNTVGVYKIDSKTALLSTKSVQDITTLPADFTNGSSADIHITSNGHFLYTSNRGHDSIAMFKINQKDGTLTSLGWESTRGEIPRGFTIYGEWLIVANQNSNNIYVFKINAKTGKLSYTGNTYEIGTAVCLWVSEF